MTLIAIMSLDLAMYMADKECLMSNDNGNYYDPLEWWKHKLMDEMQFIFRIVKDGLEEGPSNDDPQGP
jgi:hypothetical protein